MSKIELLSTFGSDEMVVNTARVSYNKEAKNYTEKQNKRLLKYLARENHWSPFSSPLLQFRWEIPIYVERQLVKHESGRVYNSISGRYVDFSDTYTKIKQFRKQSESSKQGSAGDLDDFNNKEALLIQNTVIDLAKKYYDVLVGMGIAKEQARTILPLSLNTTQIWTGSLYTFIRMCHQRLADDAQQETREVVQEMLKQVKETELFTESLKAWNVL